MKNNFLLLGFLAAFAGMASGGELADTLTFSGQYPDSVVFTNPGDRALRLDSISITTISGPGRALFFAFKFGDSWYVMPFGSADSTIGSDSSGGYTAFHGAEIPPHGRMVFRGFVTALPPFCPCEHAGARPFPHLFGVRFVGAGLNQFRLLKGDVYLAPDAAIGPPAKPRILEKGAPKLYRLDGKEIIHSQRHSVSVLRTR